MHRTNQPRSGFTLVELLVVITIIGILMGLLIPAINAARESARRAQCGTQIKNLALAATQHENTKGRLPGYIEEYSVYSGTTDPTGEATPVDGSSTAIPKVGTWAVALLPWLDAQPTSEFWTEDRYPLVVDGDGVGTGSSFHPYSAPSLKIMQCPSNPLSGSPVATNSYVANCGMYTTDSSQYVNKANGAFVPKYGTVGPDVRLDDFKDGQGNTMLFSENLVAGGWHQAGIATNADAPSENQTRYAVGMVWHPEDSTTAAAYGINEAAGADLYSVSSMTASNMTELARPSSAHVDGVNAGMADGATRYLVDSIDYQVYVALMTLRGKSSGATYPEYVLDEAAL